MSKLVWKPGTMIYPIPVAMVRCGTSVKDANIITIAWTGTMSSNPPYCYIGVRKSRYSYDIIRKTGEFVINLTSTKLVRAADWCGVKSGRDHAKFKEMKLTPTPSSAVAAPMILESPISIECRVKQMLELGSHDVFIAEVLAIHADERYLDKKTGALHLSKAGLVAYSHGQYYELGRNLGKFGFSVKKKK